MRDVVRRVVVSLLTFCAAGCGAPSFLVTPVANSQSLDEVQLKPGKGFSAPKVAMIEVEGLLVNARGGGFLQPTANPLSEFTQQLERAEADPAVRAIVLRVNSPGGTVSASDAMYTELLRFKQRTHRPVVASMQEVAASGAYYVSCASDRIVAQPTTVVGSIGVIFNTLEFADGLAKLGGRADAIKSGEMKDIGSPFKHLTPNERGLMQGMVDEYYARFVGVVKTGRPNAPVDADKTLTDGRVFSGQRAMELGLVDQVGLLEDAIDAAKHLANVPNAKVVTYKRPYGYRGSIYAQSASPTPDAQVLRLELPGARTVLPNGFYYVWQP